MIPLALRVRNFKSFGSSVEQFTFPRGPGLFFMQGVNEEEPRLDANGAGKSTLWDALTWCWFGKTARELKAGDVCNWDAGKGTLVEFDFALSEDDPCVWTMRRTWGPNSWTLSHIAEYITDEEVVDLTKEKDNPALSWLALDFDPFLNTILMAQGEPMFLDLKKDSQAGLFSSVLSLDQWLDFSKEASGKASDEDRKLRKLEQELSRAEGQLSQLGRQDFRQSLEDWEAQHKKRLADLRREHERLMDRREGLKNAQKQAQEAVENARARVAQGQPSGALSKDLGTFRGYVADYSTFLQENRIKLEAVEDHLGHLTDQKNPHCPTCGQSLNRGDHVKEIGKAESVREKLLKEKKKWERELAEARSRLAEVEEEEAKEVQELEAARQQLQDAQADLSQARRELDLLDRDLDVIEDQDEKLRGEINPYEKMQAEDAKAGRRLREEIEDLREEIDAVSFRHSLFQSWVRWFKEIRLGLTAEALTELEIEVNSGVDVLGLSGWELEFRVDRETKSGTIQRGFDCFVRSPHNEAAVPWKAWSGGESQRLRVAAQMGLSDLTRSRTGTTLMLEVWDEPTAGLSAQGIQDLLECLRTRAHREGRQIWIVDHKAHDYGGFDGGAIIRKTSKGSVVETY